MLYFIIFFIVRAFCFVDFMERWIKNDNVSLIPSAIWSCFAEINRIFCVGMWQWTKPGSFTTLRSQSGRQPSGLQSVRSVRSGKKRKCGPVRLWPQYFWMLMEFCSSTTLKKVRRSIANVTLANRCLWRTKSVRNGSKCRRKKCHFTKTCAMSQVARYHDKIEWIELRIASASTIFTGSGSQRLLPVCRPQKMLQGKRFYSNEEVITETNAYFEAKDKSFYKKCIEMLEKLWTDCVAFEGDYVDE